MIKILFVCHGNILKNPEKLVKSMILWQNEALTTPLSHHFGRSLEMALFTAK